MRTFLTIVWFLIPTIFFLMSLWAYLEKAGGRGNVQDAGSLFRQGFFCLVCAFVSLAIDSYLLDSIVEIIPGGMAPRLLLEIILLPFILYIGALIVGPSKAIQITKNQRLGPRRR